MFTFYNEIIRLWMVASWFRCIHPRYSIQFFFYDLDSYLNIITNSKSSLGIINSNGVVFSSSDNSLIGKTSDTLEQLYGKEILNSDYKYRIYKKRLVSIFLSKKTDNIYYRIDDLDQFNMEIRTMVINIITIKVQSSNIFITYFVK